MSKRFFLNFNLPSRPWRWCAAPRARHAPLALLDVLQVVLRSQLYNFFLNETRKGHAALRSVVRTAPSPTSHPGE
eukprot:12014170-Heterocapsa_arctica.AAC.1